MVIHSAQWWTHILFSADTECKCECLSMATAKLLYRKFFIEKGEMLPSKARKKKRKPERQINPPAFISTTLSWTHYSLPVHLVPWVYGLLSFHPLSIHKVINVIWNCLFSSFCLLEATCLYWDAKSQSSYTINREITLILDVPRSCSQEPAEIPRSTG